MFVLFNLSEEKAKLRRRMGEQIDEKDIELAAFMSSLQLDHLSVEDDLDQIPQVCTSKQV